MRNARGEDVPNVREFAEIALESGAHGITLHPRPDRRHALVEDVATLTELTRSHKREFNLEGNPFAPPKPGYPGITAMVEEYRPAQCTLVPDADNQLTSDHGWDLSRPRQDLIDKILQLKELGTRVCLFVDAHTASVQGAKQHLADGVELFTGPWARETAGSLSTSWSQALMPYQQAAQCAEERGLTVNAGHDLNTDNLLPIASLPGIAEVSIGQALVADALRLGMANAVTAYLRILQQVRPT